MIKHQIFTFIARYRRVICGWNVHFGNIASIWCTDRGGPLILDDVILNFAADILSWEVFNWNYFNPTLILISSFTSFGIEGIVSKQTLKCSFLKHLFLKRKQCTNLYKTKGVFDTGIQIIFLKLKETSKKKNFVKCS